MEKLRIFLADDHEIVREGLKMLINSQEDMKCIGEASNGRIALEQTRTLLPDVLLMDISMPKLNGLHATKLIKESCPEVKVLVLTRHTEDSYLQQLLKAGASGYILKQSSFTELIHAIRGVAEGHIYLDPSVMPDLINTYVTKSTNKHISLVNKLSDREREVLRMVAWGYSNKEIAAHLDLSVKTVEAHKTNSMRKLGMKSRIDIVSYALLQGWLRNT